MPTSDYSKIATALGLFASAIRSGERWSEQCEITNNEAHEALERLTHERNQLYDVLHAMIRYLGPDGYFPTCGKTITDQARAVLGECHGD